MQAAMGTMDYIIDTISAAHSLMPLLGLLKLNGKLVTVGLPSKPLELSVFPLVAGKPSIILYQFFNAIICEFELMFETKNESVTSKSDLKHLYMLIYS
jgi:D-arabinose 1-dehydrogenase-like Zn-dependent alcohol dehydrogenase